MRAGWRRAAHLAHGIKAVQARAAIDIHGHASAEVVGCGHHGDRLLERFDALSPAGGQHRGEAGFHVQILRHRRQIQEHAYVSRGRHLGEHGPAHHIPGCQFHVFRSVPGHESLSAAIQ